MKSYSIKLKATCMEAPEKEAIYQLQKFKEGNYLVDSTPRYNRLTVTC